MKIIDFSSDAHRKKHFDFFRLMDSPHFGVTAEVDITELHRLTRKPSRLRFTPAVVYLITRTALEVTPFRWRIRGDVVVEHENLRPSFAVPTAVSSAFSFCTVPYVDDPTEFIQRAEARIESMRQHPSFEDEPGADDYLFLSTFPWASITSVRHAMDHGRQDSIPRMVWGKYRQRGRRTVMPLSVQAHHAVVDGSELGRFYQVFEKNLGSSKNFFQDF